MKNNLIALKSCNTDETKKRLAEKKRQKKVSEEKMKVSPEQEIDAWLPTHNDFLELVITSKMEEAEFVDLLNEIREILERDYICHEDEVEDETMEECEAFYYDRLKAESSSVEDTNANSLLYAGYADCMEEAIRFLIEEENISPEHPVVENLKAHLEKSKDRILQTLCFDGDNECKTCNNIGSDSPLSNIFLETFQNCRDSG